MPIEAEKLEIELGTVSTISETYNAPKQITDSSADKMFIYQHESGNNPSSVNLAGCRGLGQACPGSKLPCGNDYECQDTWFTQYMRNRYGTWAAAKAHWLARVPINGKDVGNWW